jgi:hypothetical protein
MDMLIRFSSLRYNFFLGCSAWSRKATFTFVLSVRLFVRPSASISQAPTTDFHEIWCWRLSLKSVLGIPNLYKFELRYWTLYMKTLVLVIFAGEKMRHESVFKKQYFDVFYSNM